jgi:hypothetical protein
MEKNKTGKYLKYAIGEIILVVIGILIALSINNWNEFQKGKKWERQFLEELTLELKSNQQQLTQVQDVQSLRMWCSDKILKLRATLDPSIKYKIDSLFNKIQESNKTFFPTTGVYDAALTGAKIENLRNGRVKYAIMNLYNHHYNRLVYNGELSDKMEDVIDWEKKIYYDMSEQKIRSWDHILDTDFEFQISYIKEQTEVYYGLIENSLKEITRVIELVEDHLHK